MTDKQAIEVLKSWLNLAYHNADETNESSAELYEALHTMFKLINRQKATIERLEKEHKLAIADKVIAEKHEKDAKDMFKDVVGQLGKAKSEAIKEFAERLKEKICCEDDCKYHCFDCCYECKDYVPVVDDLVKEMTEVEE